VRLQNPIRESGQAGKFVANVLLAVRDAEAFKGKVRPRCSLFVIPFRGLPVASPVSFRSQCVAARPAVF
jgi:hypothetical protein